MSEPSKQSSRVWFSPHGTEWEAETYEEALELERDSLVEAIRRARHELDQWVFADGTASYRVERAEAILDAALTSNQEGRSDG